MCPFSMYIFASVFLSKLSVFYSLRGKFEQIERNLKSKLLKNEIPLCTVHQRSETLTVLVLINGSFIIQLIIKT